MLRLCLAVSLVLSAPELAPFLVGSSHPEIPRPAATVSEMQGLEHRVWGLLQDPHAPGVRQARALAADLVEALRVKQLLYADGAWIYLRVRSALAGKLDERTIAKVVDDVDGRLDDTPVTHGTRKHLLRDLRDVLGSARRELP